MACNYASRKLRLPGELAYAVVVMAVAVWAVGQTRLARETLAHFGISPFSLKRAFIWSAFALVAVPVAVVQWPLGPFALAVGPLLVLVLYLRRHAEDVPSWRSDWAAAAGGIALVLV
ncbi:MAG: hypothetical protein H0T97_13080, partial [Actinobacteria bacterium]|nr:hypothetical protein [Actinomycetota bacterium]